MLCDIASLPDDGAHLPLRLAVVEDVGIYGTSWRPLNALSIRRPRCVVSRRGLRAVAGVRLVGSVNTPMLGSLERCSLGILATA